MGHDQLNKQGEQDLRGFSRELHNFQLNHVGSIKKNPKV